jgi:TPR repeat protein
MMQTKRCWLACALAWMTVVGCDRFRTPQQRCERGDARRCFDLGRQYERGRGVPRDLARAASFYQRACDGGDQLQLVNVNYRWYLSVGVGMSPTPIFIAD